MGHTWCRFECGIPDERMAVGEGTDGVWYWPEGLSHYVMEHRVALPEAFLDHAESVGWSISHEKVEEVRRAQFSTNLYDNHKYFGNPLSVQIGDITIEGELAFDCTMVEWKSWANDYWEAQRCVAEKEAAGVRLPDQLLDASMVPEWVARLYGVVPWRHDGPTLVLAASELLRSKDIDALSFLLRSEVNVIAAGGQVQQYLEGNCADGDRVACTRDEMNQAVRDLIWLLNWMVADDATELGGFAMGSGWSRLQYRVDGVMYPAPFRNNEEGLFERHIEVLAFLIRCILPESSERSPVSLMVRDRAVRVVWDVGSHGGVEALRLLVDYADCGSDPWPIPRICG
ncbi:MAG: hypothetical protein QF752_09110 [Planctomycetota bacterium]|nr:hypothetical protein [Planctomycetota bacterium]